MRNKKLTEAMQVRMMDSWLRIGREQSDALVQRVLEADPVYAPIAVAVIVADMMCAIINVTSEPERPHLLDQVNAFLEDVGYTINPKL
jgi:ABC-type antimicrobial peptide transport system permease subunit